MTHSGVENRPERESGSGEPVQRQRVPDEELGVDSSPGSVHASLFDCDRRDVDAERGVTPTGEEQRQFAGHNRRRALGYAPHRPR
jgi:hypothetical protein